MKTLLFAVLLAGHPESDPAREAALTRDMIEDAAIRFDDVGLALARQRAARLASDMEAVGNARLAHDAHALVATAAYAQLFTGNNDVDTLRRVGAEGLRHADRAAALDDHDAFAVALGVGIGGLMVTGGAAGNDLRAEMRERYGRAIKLDPNEPLTAILTGLMRSSDPAGPAKPEGVKWLTDLVQRLDADRVTRKRTAGLWDVIAHYWLSYVRLQHAAPDA